MREWGGGKLIGFDLFFLLVLFMLDWKDRRERSNIFWCVTCQQVRGLLLWREVSLVFLLNHQESVLWESPQASLGCVLLTHRYAQPQEDVGPSRQEGLSPLG